MSYKRRGVAPQIRWSPLIAYAVGLIATDGCLSGDGRHIAFVTKDEDLMCIWLRCVGHSQLGYQTTTSSAGNPVYRVQVSDVGLYRWLLGLGLTPRKSLTLGPVLVPSDLFVHLVRGLLDGDGSIYTLRHRPTPRSQPLYWYERLWTLFGSASSRHVHWLRESIDLAFGLKGAISVRSRAGRHDYYTLKYGNRDSLVLLAALYADVEAPCLGRKREKWRDFVRRNCAEGGI